MDQKRASFLSGQVILGISALLIGFFLLLDNLNILNGREVVSYWPVILIVLGLLPFVRPGSTGGRVWGAVLIIIGAVLLLRRMEIVDLRFHDIWPVLLILIGGSIVWGAIGKRRALPDKSPSADTESFFNGFALMSGFGRSSGSQDFRGCDLSAIMGGCEIDLRQAAIKGEEAVINTFAFWGGIEIKVPPSWRVSVRATPILGGFNDETTPPSDPTAKRLVITGLVVMGGVEITN